MYTKLKSEFYVNYISIKLLLKTKTKCHWEHVVISCQVQSQFWFIKQSHLLYLASLSEKAMAPHSSTLAWKIPRTEEPGRLQSMGWLRVGHDLATSLSFFTFKHWRRKWQRTPVFLPGESQGQGSLVGCCLQGRTEVDKTEATQQQQQQPHFPLQSCPVFHVHSTQQS